MWYYSLTVCIAFACLLCSSTSGFSSSDYDSSSSQFASDLRKARRDPRWMLEDPSFLFDKRTGIDVGTWPESEAVSSLSRQLFGDKAADSSAEQLLEEDLSVVGKKGKRGGESHSLSIVNPLDVLRQRLLLDMARRRMKENQKQISENAAILHQLGKRANDRRIQVSSSENFEV